jgi:hypothetical protein|tara:strand:- start:1130 stop:1255 length:126 start_codon:yes stop_codon:yes gene_type:complete
MQNYWVIIICLADGTKNLTEFLIKITKAQGKKLKRKKEILL